MRERFLESVCRVVPAAANLTLRDWRAGEMPVAARDRSPTAERRCADGGFAHRLRHLDAVPLDHAPLRRTGTSNCSTMAGTNGRCAARGRSADAAHSAPVRFGSFPAGRDGAAPLIGSTPAMRVLRNKIERVAATDFTVLIEGESGTGKELVARQIHELSHRRCGPLRGHQLRGARRDAARGGVVRHRGAHGDRRSRPARQVRARRRRHTLPR